MPPLTPAELADLRQTLQHPMAKAQLWPSEVLEGLIAEIDRVTDAFNSQEDDLDRFIRQQVLEEPRFAVEYLHSGACAKLRAVRRRHYVYTGPDGLDYCGYCNQITGGWIRFPCDTILDVGVEDEFESLAASRGQGTPRARAIAAMSSPDQLVDGIDLSKPYADRDGVIWSCIGWFQAWGREEWHPMMSTMTGRHPEYTLATWLRVRGPVTLADSAAALMEPGAHHGEILVFQSIGAGIEECRGEG